MFIYPIVRIQLSFVQFSILLRVLYFIKNRIYKRLITVHMYSVLLDTDSFSFIIFKRLYHTSFKLNIVNFSSVLPHGPLEHIEGLTVHRDPQLRFISQFMQNAKFFSFPPNALVRNNLFKLGLFLSTCKILRINKIKQLFKI